MSSSAKIEVAKGVADSRQLSADFPVFASDLLFVRIAHNWVPLGHTQHLSFSSVGLASLTLTPGCRV